MTETLIKKETIYCTEHIIGMKRTETKTKEETFIDLILGMEKNNIDTRETQGKKTLET